MAVVEEQAVGVLAIYTPDPSTRQELDYYLSTASAGFPSPADDYIQCKLDLTDYVVKHPAATFFVKASGDSMRLAGIHSGDLLVVDRSITPTSGHVVIAVIDGGFTVKRLKKVNGVMCLAPENDAYMPIPMTEDTDATIWGVVTHVVHKP